MKPVDVERVFEQLQPQHLRYVGLQGSTVVIAQSVPEGAAKEWILWVSLQQGKAAAVRIRTNDSPAEKPRDAPPDIVWTDEDSTTVFARQAAAGER